MSNGVIRIINNRKYKSLSTHMKFALNTHKTYEQFLIITLVNEQGNISFEIKDNEKITKLDNPESGTYTIPLSKASKVWLFINSSSACGSYKIQTKTIKE